MANDYFTRSASFAPRTKAKSEDVKSELDAVSAGFDLLPIPLNDGTGFSSPLVVGEAVEQEHAVRLSQITSAESSIGANTQIVLDAKAATLAAKDSVDQLEADINSTAAEVVANKNLSEQSKTDAQQAANEAEQHSLTAETFADASSASAAVAIQKSADTVQSSDDSQTYALQSEQSADAAKNDADRAANLIAMLPAGAIDDTVVSPVKTWSSEKISNKSFVRTPLPIFPLTGAEDLSLVPELSAEAFRNAYNETRTVRRFQVDLLSGDFSTPVYEHAEDIDSHTIANPLTAGERYKWRCRDETSYENSEWSDVQGFLVSIAYIFPPTILTAWLPALTTPSSFSTYNGTDAHESTDWVICENGVVIYESLDNTIDLKEFSVPLGVLEDNTEYTF